MRVWRRRVAYSQLKPKRQEVPAKTLSVCPDDPSLPVVKFCLLFLRPKWGWHLNKIISVTPSDFRPLSHPFVLYTSWTGGSFLSLGLGQPWPCLDLLSLLPLLFGIAFHGLQLVLLSYHPIFLHPYHFLKLVSFLGANRTKSACVCLWLL